VVFDSVENAEILASVGISGCFTEGFKDSAVHFIGVFEVASDESISGV